MKGLTVAAVGAPYVVSHDLETPEPGPKQILVKSLFAGINPVETFVQSTGMLVESWPIVLGTDASGIVVKIGSGVTRFKVGDGAYGCTKVGVEGFGTFQEYFLMDEGTTFLNTGSVSFAEGATVGAGLETAALGLIAGMGLDIPAPGKKLNHDEWIIVLGGSGAVGSFSVQLASVSGYKVLATCSSSKANAVKGNGAVETVDYKLPLSDQIEGIKKKTGGNFARVFDCTSHSAPEGFAILKESTASQKYFATTDDWTPMEEPIGINVYRIHLGMIGKLGTEQAVVTSNIESYVPKLEKLIEAKEIKPMAYKVVGEGFDAIPDAIKLCDSGTMGGTKILIQIQDV